MHIFREHSTTHSIISKYSGFIRFENFSFVTTAAFGHIPSAAQRYNADLGCLTVDISKSHTSRHTRGRIPPTE